MSPTTMKTTTLRKTARFGKATRRNSTKTSTTIARGGVGLFWFHPFSASLPRLASLQMPMILRVAAPSRSPKKVVAHLNGKSRHNAFRLWPGDASPDAQR